MTSFFLLCVFSGKAQFTITDDFRNQGSSDIVIGDGAYFTSGVDDPTGAGWLRLTKSETNQKGYAYIDRTFPSSLGLLIDFEYKMWRNAGSTNAGADGMTFFLFDGGVTQSNFRLGGYGGSLGYARNTSANPTVNNGLRGGYIGVGLDAYGNFSNPNEGRNLGPGMRPNAIVIRGATNETTSANSNPFLVSKELGIRTGTDADVRGRDEIDYNTIVTTRPGDAAFYRRVQLEIIPTTGGLYRIILRWKKALTGAFIQEIEYLTTEVPPSLLKLGFAASTGSDLNFHELRNLQITTPRNLRVSKRANKDILRSVPAGMNADQITYVIEVVNDTDQAYTSATFLDELRDIDGNMIPSDMFDITNITSSGFTSISIAESTTTANRIEGTLSIAPGVTGLIQVTGKLSKIPSYNVLRNTVTVLPTNGVDFDLGNNTAVVNTPVIAENVDMTVSKVADEACLDATNGNLFTITATNMGAIAASYNGYTISGSSNTSRTYSRSRIELTEIVPSGVTVVSSTIPSDWTLVATQNNTPSTGLTSYVYRTTVPANSLATSGTWRLQSVAHSSLNTGISLPSITYTLRGSTSFVNRASVRYITETGTVTRNSNTIYTYDSPTVTAIEAPENLSNNSAAAAVDPVPANPTVPNNTIYYCLGQTATSLSTAASTNATGTSLIWYLNLGGTPATVAPTPSTTVAGATSYYVSQRRGNCASALVKIDVIVLSTPSAGVIAGAQTTCSSANTTTITSTTAGQATGWPTGTTIAYRWESSANGSTGWNTILGATSATYAPGALTATTHYRRITVATISGKSCESAVTNTVIKTVNTVNAGVISDDQTICTGGSFTQISSTTPGSGSATTVTYRWENSATGAAGSWTTISGATAATYTPVNTVTTYFRRVTISTLNGVVCEAASNTIVKTINTVNAGVIAGNQNVCTSIAATQITSTTPGTGAGAITYRWEISTTGTGGWSTITGATGTTHTPVNTTTMYFRRVTISTLNTIPCEAASGVITVAFKNCKMITNPMIRQRTK